MRLRLAARIAMRLAARIAMRLAARIAASRFAQSRRRSGRVAGSVWMPLALRWRQRRKRVAGAGVFPTATPAVTMASFLAQVHLHFPTHAAGGRNHRHEVISQHALIRELQRSVMRHRSTTVRSDTRVTQSRVMQRESWTVRSVTKSHQVVPVERAARSLVFRTACISVVRTQTFTPATASARSVVMTAPTAPRGDVRSFGIPIPATITHRRRHSLVEPIRKSTGPISSAHEPLQCVARPASLIHRQLHVFRTSSTFTAAGTRRSRKDDPVKPIRLPSPTYLVWRTTPRVQTDVGADAPFTTSPAAVFRAPARADAAQDPTTDIARRNARTPLQAADFDPAFLDRLTDDVIRRAERRARIERERRGL